MHLTSSFWMTASPRSFGLSSGVVASTVRIRLLSTLPLFGAGQETRRGGREYLHVEGGGTTSASGVLLRVHGGGLRLFRLGAL